MSTTDTVYTPPCIQCAHRRKTCRVRNRNRKCNRCNEKDLDCSLRRDVRASETDQFLPELISNVEAHMGRADEVYQSMTQSQASLVSLGNEILQEMRKMSAGVSPGWGPGLMATSQEGDSGYLRGSASQGEGDSASQDRAETVAVRQQLFPDLGGDGSGVGAGAKGGARKKEKDDAEEYVPSSPEASPKRVTRGASNRRTKNRAVVNSDESAAESDKRNSKSAMKTRSGTGRESSNTLSEGAMPGSSKSTTSKKRTAADIESSSSDEHDDENSGHANKRSRSEAEQDHQDKFQRYKANRLQRARGGDSDHVVIKTEKL